MAAPKGNEFWKMASKPGRERIFKEPEILLKAAEEYFQWCVDNPLMEVDFRGKNIQKVELPKMRAFSIEGLTLFLGVNTLYFRDFKKSLEGKTDSKSLEYSQIITRIEQIIWAQQYEGAAAGFLHPNIVARRLGLVDKSSVELVPDEETKKNLDAFHEKLRKSEPPKSNDV